MRESIVVSGDNAGPRPDHRDAATSRAKARHETFAPQEVIEGPQSPDVEVGRKGAPGVRVPATQESEEPGWGMQPLNAVRVKSVRSEVIAGPRTLVPVDIA